VATTESKKRMERRRRQRWREQFNREPEVIALCREIARRQKYRQRHPFSGQHPGLRGLLYLHCVYAGIRLGGRPPRARRCTKRLGSRLCWGWREAGLDRCMKHRRAQVRSMSDGESFVRVESHESETERSRLEEDHER
jgi:hypothetical protein